MADVKIEFCTTCHYLPKAKKLQAAILAAVRLARWQSERSSRSTYHLVHSAERAHQSQ